MKIQLRYVKVRELLEGYEDRQEGGVVGYGGRLDIRPAYQREFIYDDAQRKAVIETVMQGYPLNVMYWADCGNDTYEMIDGQQRTLSICQYHTHGFNVDLKKDGKIAYFDNLSDEQKERFLDYELTVYVCTGSESEKIAWFRTINIAGERLNDQELLNATYRGPFVTQAKRYFSKTHCPADAKWKNYLNGATNRQDLLRTAMLWHLQAEGREGLEDYMAVHQFDESAEPLWKYFDETLTWVTKVFTKYRKEMKGVDWGTLYRLYHTQAYDAAAMEKEVASLMANPEITKKSGIYFYVFDRKEKHLSLRAFDDITKRECYEQQKGLCALCGKAFELKDMDADHIKPWSKGGKTTPDNCQMLCRECNIKKSNR